MPTTSAAHISIVPRIPADFAARVIHAALSEPTLEQVCVRLSAEVCRAVPCDAAIFVAPGAPVALPHGHHLSGRLVVDGVELATLHLSRARGRKAFDLGELHALTEVLPVLTLAYAARMGSGVEPAVAAAPLPPRAREVLRHLLAGRSEKEVAYDMTLSRHTVHQYVKRIYRAHGVRSRGELLARLLSPAGQGLRRSVH
jgi:DNA-binding CsgD family transcriptional regulator